MLPFERQLWDFLGKDYDGASPDRVAIPDSGSLVEEDGTFLLYRLTDGPVFQCVKKSIASIEEISRNVFAGTPGKIAFDWIRQAVDWIENVRSAVTVTTPVLGPARLIIRGGEARALLRRGEEVLLDVPDDLRKTLNEHRIAISISNERTLLVRTKKGCADNAVGATVIRWCPFVLNALRHDISELDDWETSIEEISENFLSMDKGSEDKQRSDPSTLLLFHNFREDLIQLLEESNELVVAPSAKLIECARTLLENINIHIKTHSNNEIARVFAESRYCNGGVVTTDRFRLLDALISRRVIAPNQNETPDSELMQGSFRGSARMLLAKALSKGMLSMDLLNSENSSDFCAFKAWEIEQALFESYQDELGESQISPEYREKARTLRRSLEDSENLVLCAKVLAGEITADDLAWMPTDQLANPKTKKDREIAAAVARKGLLLTGAVSPSKTEITSLANQNSVTSVPKKNPTTSENSSQCENISTIETPKQPQPTNTPFDQENTSCQKEKETVTPNVESEHSSPAYSPSPSPNSTKKAAVKPGEWPKSGRLKLAPPPPPPSLVASLNATAKQNTIGRTAKSASASHIVTTISGSDEFVFTVADGSRTFLARLYAETDPDSQADGLLPDKMTEKGRLRISEFKKFLKSKLVGGRWIVITMKVSTKNEKDAKEYKKFYKEYEGKQRIAMFSLEDGAKLFLVTPMFHKDVVGVTFGKATSTYGVALVRKQSK